MSTLRIEDLAVHFGAVRAVDGVDLTVADGTIHGVIGPNGAGKSTLIDAVSGRVPLTKGRVFVDDDEITTRSITWRRRNGMARSFQRTSVFPSLTIREQLELVAGHVGEDSIDELVDLLELRPLLDRPCGVVAYGDQRRVDLGLALLGRPSVLLLDEPAAGLTAEETARLVAHIAELAEHRSLTIVLVEHDVDAVFSTCDVVTVMNMGKVLVTGSPEQVRADTRVIEAYLGSAA